MKAILFLVVAGAIGLELEHNSTDGLDSVEDIFFDDLDTRHNASSKCHARLSECHTIATVLGVMVAGLLLINIITIVWFNRAAIHYQLGRFFPRLAPQEEEDEEPVLHDHRYDDEIIRFR